MESESAKNVCNVRVGCAKKINIKKLKKTAGHKKKCESCVKLEGILMHFVID